MGLAIKVENLSKVYQLGQFSTGTLSRDIERGWALLRGKEDPFLKIGETNNRVVKGESDVVWSLKDINFEIEQGDAVGIIGKNGAGKSTLLKVLSRVTSPTSGEFKIKGRVASLLEVGTGFHPELTGKENIFLNGAILGMRKKEIRKSFDEIVDFAGIERYIDTPVKRYSSGMYVRLAFAVAAHLESDILIVDEVLAVGDAEFQKKCLGKMGDITGQGRTILFVSHNMGAVSSLCSESILLIDGEISEIGKTKEVIATYSKPKLILSQVDLEERLDRTGNGKARVKSVVLKDHNGRVTETINSGEPFSVEVSYIGYVKRAHVSVILNGALIENIIQANSFYSHDELVELDNNKFVCFFDNNDLLEGAYNISIAIGEFDTRVDTLHNCLSFYVESSDVFKTGRVPVKCGLVYTHHNWKFN